MNEPEIDIESGIWQPIETAPKDGSRVILCLVPNEVNLPSEAKTAIGCWYEYQWKDGLESKIGAPWWDWKYEGDQGPMSLAPTHWMPLPVLPNLNL